MDETDGNDYGNERIVVMGGIRYRVGGGVFLYHRRLGEMTLNAEFSWAPWTAPTPRSE